MIKNPFILIGLLFTIEFVILYLANHPQFKKYFNFLPSMFWIYFLPMLASSVGFIDAKSAVYGQALNYVLPASLFLILVCVDLKMILRLGTTALFTFFIGSFGIMLGTVVVFFIFKRWIGPEFAPGFAALSASWTGGSANMIAVKEALSTPDAVFAPMVIVDTIVPYVWMGLLIMFSASQGKFDRWNKTDRRILDDINQRVAPALSSKQGKLRLIPVILLIVLGSGVSLAVKALAGYLPVIKGVIAASSWPIILVSTLALICSLTPLRKLENFSSQRVGYYLLYFVLTTIGAKASIQHLGTSFILIIAGFLIVTIHAVILLTATRLMRIPLFLSAASSQANIGGVASAPVVAEIYQPGFSAIGLLMAILGNIVGTYLGIITGQICSFVAGR